MTQFEYKVIPTPTKGRKAPGLKTAEARFANTVQDRMNELAADGWLYLRSDLLPSEERQGLTSSQTVYRSVLVFHRELTEAVPDIVEPVKDDLGDTTEADDSTEESLDEILQEDDKAIPSDPTPEDTETAAKVP